MVVDDWMSIDLLSDERCLLWLRPSAARALRARSLRADWHAGGPHERYRAGTSSTMRPRTKERWLLVVMTYFSVLDLRRHDISDRAVIRRSAWGRRAVSVRSRYGRGWRAAARSRSGRDGYT